MTDKRSASADEDSAGQPLESANGGRSISGLSAALLDKGIPFATAGRECRRYRG
jgi:hypothetical protein